MNPSRPQIRSRFRPFWILAAGLLSLAFHANAAPLRVAPFSIDITPSIGAQLAYENARRVDDPLYARGLAILSDQEPIVLCAVDHIGISNGGQDAWKKALAEAAGTTSDRVAIHALHQHDAPRCDLTVEAMIAEVGLGGKTIDLNYVERILGEAAAALRKSVKNAQPVTHLGVGRAKVDRVASNRRVLGPDGKIQHVRWSGMPRTAANYAAIEAPEGVIDPWMRLVSFWNGDHPIASLTYYATHPQSYYLKGGISADIPGLARAYRDQEEPAAVHIHFNGAGGNVAAGKYNDKSPAARYFLSNRAAEGMRQAWANITKVPVNASHVDWRVRNVELPINDRGSEEALEKKLNDIKAFAKDRLKAASELAYVRRVKSGRGIDLTCLRIKDVHILHMPGELFVEYQLWAQEMRPDEFVCMAAYGEYSPGYIGTRISYSQGGYETSKRASRTTPAAEALLLKALRELLGVKER